MRRGRHARRVSLVLAAAAVLGACSGGGGSAGPEGSPSGTSDAAPPSDAGTASVATPDATVPPLTVAASRDGHASYAGAMVPVRADLAPLQRRGDLVVLNLVLTHTGEDGSWQVSDGLDDGTTNGLEGSVQEQDPARYSVDGITLVDGENAKRYLVARDERGWCVCSASLHGLFLEPGGSVVLSATFAAPPEDVEAMDVEVPLFGTFAAVPVQS